MQRLVVFAVLIVAGQSLDSKLVAEFVEKATEIGTECAKETKASSDDIARIINHQMPETKEGKCMISCFYKTFKMQNEDGSFNPNGGSEWMERIKKSDEVEHGKIQQIFNECMKPDNYDSSDHCQTAANVATCVFETAKKVGLSSEIMNF
ncbi:unnamed protein product [Phaedon cochleariae]|uniref:Uncharacterized protein n=1 Tax=Phaedon cochleariae TaxID=80249 RepID=A0A9P0GMR6_PHACE|nr:unnamed protein product [Phaedon cochleariae]